MSRRGNYTLAKAREVREVQNKSGDEKFSRERMREESVWSRKVSNTGGKALDKSPMRHFGWE